MDITVSETGLQKLPANAVDQYLIFAM